MKRYDLMLLLYNSFFLFVFFFCPGFLPPEMVVGDRSKILFGLWQFKESPIGPRLRMGSCAENHPIYVAELGMRPCPDIPQTYVLNLQMG